MKRLFSGMLWSFFGFCGVLYSNSTGCIFCDQDLIASEKLFETDLLVVIADCDQTREGHVLIVPKRHTIRLDQMTTQELSELGPLAKKVAEFFACHLHTNQYQLIQRNGLEAGQTVPHAHFHMIPIRTKHTSIGLGTDEFSRLEKLITDYRQGFHALFGDSSP